MSDFGGGTDAITNTGTVRTANTANSSEATTFANAGTFSNAGLLTLSDEIAGNGSVAHDSLTINGNFIGGGILAVDAYLGAPGSTADLLTIHGNVTGVTQVQVRNTNPGQGVTNTTGIAIVKVNGSAAAGDFVLLGGPISAGLFGYDMTFDAANTIFKLVSTGASTKSTELAALASASQSIWYDTSGVMDEHFTDLHKDMRSAVMDDGSQAHAAADVAGPDKGLWGKIIGRTSDRNVSSTLSYGLDTTGIMVGLDGVAGNSSAADGTLVLGLMGGYVNANQDFDSGSNGAYEGFTTGLYASYINGNFHTDAQVKADFLTLDYVLSGTPGTSNADVTNLGGSIESGYCMDLSDQFYAEPVVQLAYVNTTVRNGAILGTGFAGDGTSLRGAVGLNLGGKLGDTTSGMIFKPELSAKLWNEFSDNNSASFSSFTVTDQTPGLFGELGLGLEAINLDSGWSGTLKGDIQFAKNFSSLGGFVGLRKEF